MHIGEFFDNEVESVERRSLRVHVEYLVRLKNNKIARVHSKHNTNTVMAFENALDGEFITDFILSKPSYIEEADYYSEKMLIRHLLSKNSCSDTPHDCGFPSEAVPIDDFVEEKVIRTITVTDLDGALGFELVGGGKVDVRDYKDWREFAYRIWVDTGIVVDRPTFFKNGQSRPQWEKHIQGIVNEGFGGR